MQSVFRFAPSPNGYLHLGHAFSALLNQDMARRTGGSLLLRLEDIDRARCTDAYADAAKEDLHWLGVEWVAPARRQSDNLPRYAAILDRLIKDGLVFPCFCTRADVRAAVAARGGGPSDPDGVPCYPGTCKDLARRRARQLADAIPAAYRLDMAAALSTVRDPLEWLEFGESDGVSRPVRADPGAWGDPVIARRDMPASYHLAVVADDAAQGITDVVRGLDLFAAAGLHRLLQALLGLSAPRYHHHRLILDQAGHKLSKSRQAPSLRGLRLSGTTPGEIRRLLQLG